MYNKTDHNLFSFLLFSESIVEILWENGASVKTKNRKKQTPLDCAHNIKVARILVKASEDRDRQIRRRSSDTVLVGKLYESSLLSQCIIGLPISLPYNSLYDQTRHDGLVGRVSAMSVGSHGFKPCKFKLHMKKEPQKTGWPGVGIM